MSEEYVINLPLGIQSTKKKIFYLNLNIYRNAHFQELNKIKVKFTEAIAPLLKHIPKLTKCDITYTLYYGSKRNIDLSNICSIVDKFFCDSLTSAGILMDDNIEFISNIKYEFGGLDPINPRVEAKLHNIEKDEQMKISIVQIEIEQAIKEYIERQISIKEGQEISISLKAGRGEDGYTADIDIKSTGNVTQSISKPDGIETAIDDTPVAVDTPIEAESPFLVDTAANELPVDKAGDEYPDQVASSMASTNATSAPTAVTENKGLFAGLQKPVNTKPAE